MHVARLRQHTAVDNSLAIRNTVRTLNIDREITHLGDYFGIDEIGNTQCIVQRNKAVVSVLDRLVAS